ncbi:YbaB/EbfC family nucleoid-associated protein [Actinokineospora terrae]|uniref:YbaB/EbfC DNA-binding family protein n=1 Tax=Actinokineospora terrae TaxID=155974 RepID=A0A1H9XM64_9PSEU|nr:YbaB/EbfC family nucleoid-associated protein [Actinokineospora terrae]SES47191.1 YbaB/EbfC DNA-binding family protein [Actinokineospora terrae]
MTDPAEHRARLEARNAAMRENVAGLLADLNRRTSELADAQGRVAAVTGSATSPDGLVRAVVNPAGVLTELTLAPTAFTRSTPEKLARLVVATAQAAAGSARDQVDALLAPLQAGTDLSSLVEGAPSFADLLRPPAAATPPPAAPRHAAEDDDDDFGGVFGGRR